MKKFFILIITLFIVIEAMAQSCLPLGIEFMTQSQIDSFQINYPNCTQIDGNVEILGSGITNLNGLNVLTSIGGYLVISGIDNLISLTGLNSLTYIGDFFWIDTNPVLTNLTGLDNLTFIGGDFSINWNNDLINLVGLQNLNSIGNNVIISNCNALTSMTGLDNLTSIGGNLWILYNNSLSSLMGLENLTYLGGTLQISSNEALTSLTAMGNLASIGDEIYIDDCNVLTNLLGLENIDADSITNLYIYNNMSLSTCEVKSICDYLANPNGTIEIGNNAIGCNSQQEVEAACRVGFEENNLCKNYLNINPNPTSNYFTIKTPVIGHLSILNFSGQEFLQCEITETETLVDVRTLSSGVYLLKLINNKTVGVIKLIKE